MHTLNPLVHNVNNYLPLYFLIDNRLSIACGQLCAKPVHNYGLGMGYAYIDICNL